MSDLFESTAPKQETYSAQDIQVLEGLEAVRARPGMYIGGTDAQALHHLVAEILDNSMDEAVAGYANRIEVKMNADYSVTITDNGRGIPVDPHPKYPDMSALEVILTMLHSGGKFGGGAYKVSGGLHGVGLSVVNALSSSLVVEIARDKKLYRQTYAKGKPTSALELVGNAPNRRGTSITFQPDPEIFGSNSQLNPNRVYRMARSKAFLFKGIFINWKCAPEVLSEGEQTPQEAELHYPNGLLDFLNYQLGARATVNRMPFSGDADLANDEGRVEWSITWPEDENGFCYSYCNTVITPEGGTHEMGFRAALIRSLKEYGEMANVKKAASVTAEDLLSDACVMLSVFIRDPQFQGQTKDKLTSVKAIRLVEQAVKDSFDHWLSSDKENATALLEYVIERAESRKKKKEEKIQNRKTPTKKLRLPGKLADCSQASAENTEIFIENNNAEVLTPELYEFHRTDAFIQSRGRISNPVINLPVGIVQQVIIPGIHTEVFGACCQLVWQLYFVEVLTFNRDFPYRVVFRSSHIDILVIVERVNEALAVIATTVTGFHAVSFQLDFRTGIIGIIEGQFLLLFRIHIDCDGNRVMLNQAIWFYAGI